MKLFALITVGLWSITVAFRAPIIVSRSNLRNVCSQSRARRQLPIHSIRSENRCLNRLINSKRALKGTDEEEEDYDDEPVAHPSILQGQEEITEYYEEPLEEDKEALEAYQRAALLRLKSQSVMFQKVGWAAWWVQSILSSVSGVIILFSNAITERSIRGSIVGNGVFLAGLGVLSSCLSIFWTWSTIRKARAWVGRNVKARSSPAEAQKNIRSALKIGVWINLLGMFCALIGAEQIVGTLVAKVLYSGGIGQGSVLTSIQPIQQLRALDIFVIQANTNTLLSLFGSLLANLLLLTRSNAILLEPKSSTR